MWRFTRSWRWALRAASHCRSTDSWRRLYDNPAPIHRPLSPDFTRHTLSAYAFFAASIGLVSLVALWDASLFMPVALVTSYVPALAARLVLRLAGTADERRHLGNGGGPGALACVGMGRFSLAAIFPFTGNASRSSWRFCPSTWAKRSPSTAWPCPACRHASTR
jgi:hypothetical protein